MEEETYAGGKGSGIAFRDIVIVNTIEIVLHKTEVVLVVVHRKCRRRFHVRVFWARFIADKVGREAKRGDISQKVKMNRAIRELIDL